MAAAVGFARPVVAEMPLKMARGELLIALLCLGVPITVLLPVLLLGVIHL
jgi:hypothetical protein